MGEYTVALAAQITATRRTLNETRALQGPKHPSTLALKTKLTELRRDASYLFSTRHN